jgi:NitT/TauT family transport system substrate-binding protein
LESAEKQKIRRITMKMGKLVVALLATTQLIVGAAHAQENMKLAVGQRGNWDTSVPEIGVRGGIFARHGLTLEILYTQGGGETQQAVLSASVDVGVAAGTLGVLGAFAKGAPVRVIGAQATGAADYWYVRADSPLRTIAQAQPSTTIAYSTNGSSTHTIVRGFVRQHDLKSRLVAAGGPPATFTQVMSGQIDVGWASPPFGLDALDQNRIRIVGRGNDLPEIAGQTVRLLIANAQTLERRRAVFERFMAAYRETVEWMYTSPQAIDDYAAFANVQPATAKRVRDEFFPKAMLLPDEIKGLPQVMADGVEFKTIDAPLSADQLARLIQIPPRR